MLFKVLGNFQIVLALVMTTSVLFRPSLSYAQSTTTTADNSSSGAKKNNANKSVAQGLSIAESMLLNQSPWGFYFFATATRGLDEYADTWSSVNEMSLSYRIDSNSAIGASLGYETLIYEKGGSFLNNQDRDPGRFGFTDFSLSYTRPKIWSDKYNRLVWSSEISLPTSRVSRRSGMLAEASTTLALRYQPNSKVIITPSLGAYYSQFSYDTANAMGTLPNVPFGVYGGLAGSYVFHRYVIASLSYSNNLRYDFFGDWRVVQTAVARLIVNATDTLNLSFGYRWRDRIITNDPLFDDDKSIYIIGVGYVF